MKNIIIGLFILLAYCSSAYAYAPPGGPVGAFQTNGGNGAFAGSPPPAALKAISSGLLVDPRAYGATCSGAWYSIVSSVLGSGGSGYAPGDTFIIENNSTGFGNHVRGGVNATGHVLTVDGSGTVLTYAVDVAGTGYYNGTIGTYTTRGSGSGLTVTVTVNGTPAKPTVTLASGGSGWAVGDTFYIPNSTSGNYMTGRVVTVSGTAVATFTISNAGGDYSTGTNINANAFVGLGRGLQVNITSVTGNAANGTWDDTYGLIEAGVVATAFGGGVMVPDQCWGQNIMPVNGANYIGQSWTPNYGYSDLEVSGSFINVSKNPHLFIYGTPNFGFDFNNQGGLSFVGFEVRAYASAAFGDTGCLGSYSGGGGFSYLGVTIPTIRLYNMSAKGCDAGLGNPGGTGSLLFVVSQNSDYGGNNEGIWGPFSDFVSSMDTVASNGVGIWLSASAGGLARIIAPRLEYDVTGIELDAGGIQTEITSAQFDRIVNCAVSVKNARQVSMTGGIVKGAGLAGTLTVTGAADNGSGAIRLTVTGFGSNPSGGGTATSGLTTGDIVNITGVTGTTEANGTWTLTKIDGSHIDLQSSTFTHAYVSGGLGGVNGKSAYICLNNSTDFHTVGTNFYGYSAGQHVAPSYVVDSVTSSAISMIGGSANLGNGDSGGYRQSFANWQGGIPANVNLDVAGNAPCRNDNTNLSIDCVTGAIALGATSATAGSSLDGSANTDSWRFPNGTTAQRPASPAAGECRANSDNSDMECFYGGVWNTINASPLIPFYIGGLTLSNDVGTPTTILDIANGGAASDDSSATMVLNSPVTKTLGAWTVGTGNGCLDTGSVALSTWYHIFLIERLDTAVTDVLCSLSATSPTYPANYSVKRRIGSIKTDGSSHILAFTQIGSIFWWGTPTLDINISNLSTSGALQTLNVPPGIKTTPICRYTMSKDGNSVLLTSPDEADQAPSNANPMTAAPGQDTSDQTIAAGTTNTACPLLTTNTASQIRARSSASSTTLSIVTRGWVD